MKSRNFFRTGLRLAVHIGSILPIIILAIDFFTNHLTANPIQAAEQRTGLTALTLLVLTLSVSPLNNLLKIPTLVSHRRTLGLYTLFYASMHVILYVGIDYGFGWGYILQSVVEKPYIYIGLTSFIILSALGITSFNWWKKKLGKNWKRLHKLIYPLGLLVVFHFGWSVKGDFLRLRGDVFRPVMYGLIVLLLLVLRIPALRRVLGKFKPWITQHARSRLTAGVHINPTDGGITRPLPTEKVNPS